MQSTTPITLPRRDVRLHLVYLVSGLLLINVVIWATTWGYLQQRYDQLLKHTHTNARNLAQLLASNIASGLQQMDLALQATSEEVERQRRHGKLDPDAILAYMERMHQRVPGPDGFRIVAPNGDVLHATGPHKAGQNLADREYFQKLRDDPKAGMVISRPLFGRIRNTWAINIGRRINRPNGEFDGIVYGPIDLKMLSASFGRLDIGANGTVALRNELSEIVARLPYTDAEGNLMFARIATARELHEALASGQDQVNYQGLSSLDGIERVFSFIRIKDYGLSLSVGLAVEDFIGEWHKERHIVILGAGFCSLFSFISAFLLWRSWQRRRVSLLTISREQARLRAFAKVSADWFWEFDPEGRFTWLSSGMQTKSGLPPELLIGRTCFEVAHEPAAEESARLRDLIAQQQRINDWCLPLIDQQGTLHYLSLSGTPFYDRDRTFLGYLGCGNDITAKVQAERHFHHLAHHDPLTDLPNRTLFEDRLEQSLLGAQRAQSRLALMFIDLDRFKPINDEYGHAAGDAILVESAKRMRNAVRTSDTVARIGGDEFVIILPDIESNDAAVKVAEKISLLLQQPFPFEKHLLQVSSSIGIALYPEHCNTAKELAALADAAMYQAKHVGFNGIRVSATSVKRDSPLFAAPNVTGRS